MILQYIESISLSNNQMNEFSYIHSTCETF